MKELLSLIALVIIVVVITQLGFAMRIWNVSFWGTRLADADRAVFEQSKSYRDGTVRDLENLTVEYASLTDADAKAVVLSTIRHRVAGVPADIVPAATQRILNQ